MALGDFFRINMPYGIKRNDKGEWFAFNREYMPLGWNSSHYKKSIGNDDVYSDLPIHTKYKGLTESILVEIANSDKDDSGVRKDEQGKINMVFFYKDATNPQTHPKYWDTYFEKIKILSALVVDQITY